MRFATILAAVMALAGAALSAEPEKVQLKHRYLPGNYVETVTVDMQQTMASGVQTSTATTHNVMEMTLQVSQPDAAGDKKVAMNFRRIVQSTEQGGRKMEYDSAKPAEGQDPTLAKILGALTKVSVSMVAGPDEKIKEVSGLDKMWDQFVQAEPRMARFVAGMRKGLGDEGMKKMMESMSENFPAKPVGPGDTWQVKTKIDIPLMGPTELTQDCKLKQIDTTPAGPVAHIAIDGKIKSATEQTTTLGEDKIKVKSMDMDIKGDMRINVANPMLMTAQMDQTGTLEMNVQTPSEQQRDLKIVMKMKIEAKVEREGPTTRP